MQTSAESVVRGFDFLKYRYIWIGISVLYLLVGAAAYVLKGGFKYHIDFTGGAELRISFENPVEIGTVREVISSEGWKEATIQTVGNANKQFLIRIGSMDANTEQKLKGCLERIPDNKATVDNVQIVGAEVGKDATYNAVMAVLLALAILLAYIAVRFEFRFGVAAVVCLIHDVLAVLAFLLITGEPISLHILASVLAVLGYSLNDTIVIFSRIRENFVKNRAISDYDNANLSNNQTLRRTLLTSFATTLSVVAILVLGGENLYGLSSVMLVGIIVGTYSSIYIASPVMLIAGRRKNA